MKRTVEQRARPVLVDLALIILLASFALSLAPQFLHADWASPFVVIKLGSELLIILVPLWFTFRGKNWARWLFAALACTGFCFRLPELVRQVQEHSIPWIIAYRWQSVIETAAVIALFLPVSGRWFRGEKHAIDA